MKYDFELQFISIIVSVILLLIGGINWLLAGIFLFSFAIFYEINRIRKLMENYDPKNKK